ERAEAKAYADERAAELQRQAQVARLKELAEQAERDKLTEAVEEVEGRKRKRYKPRKEIPVGRLIVFGVLGLSLAAVAALHYLPLTPVNTRLEKALAQWIHDDVSSERLRVALFPSPYVKLDQLALGKAYDAKAASGRLNMDIGSVLGDRFVVQSMELNDVTIALEALPRALKWADANNRGDALEIDTITLRNVKTELRGVGIEVFDAEIGLDKKGRVTRATARTRDGKWTLDAVRDTSVPANEAGEQPWKIDFSARNWTPQMAGGIPISSLTLKGTWLGDDIVFPEAEARLFEGSFKGSAKVNLSKGIVATGEFNVERAKIDEIVGTFTRVVATTGKVEGAIAVTLAASSVGGLLEQPTIVGNFTARDGSISNIDLVQAMRNPGSVGGQTKFSELTGKLRVSDGVVRLEGMKLSGGVLFAGGSVGIVANSGALSGNVQAEIRSNVAQDRANFSVSGTVARPALKRGG
ncbi:MAG: AsmA-like C-terminal region-containing protein, partial [Burkholderiales bacterium]